MKLYQGQTIFVMASGRGGIVVGDDNRLKRAAELCRNRK